MSLYRRGGKRLLDALLAGAALVLLSPLLAITAAAIWLEDRHGPLFRQERVGRHGRPFRLVKFRSMPVGTPSVPSDAARQLRVTRVGRLIRLTNVDELPQLWCVLRGDMSLVGPRPALPSQRELVALRRARGVEALAPGLTGLAQVNAYDGMPESEKVEWDARYVARVGLAADLGIMLATVGYLLRRPPVY
jgi:O-antigen biosynthesis protein WbqP